MLRSATSPSRLMPFRPRARLQLRHLVGIDTNMIMPAVRRTLDHAGLQCVKIVPETDADFPCQPIGPEQRTGALCGRFNTAHDGGDAGDPAEPRRVGSEHHIHLHSGPANDLGAVPLSGMRPARRGRAHADQVRASGPGDHGWHLLGPGASNMNSLMNRHALWQSVGSTPSRRLGRQGESAHAARGRCSGSAPVLVRTNHRHGECHSARTGAAWSGNYGNHVSPSVSRQGHCSLVQPR